VLKLRLLTVAVVLPAFVAGLWLLPNAWWAAAVFLVAALAAREWVRLAALGTSATLVFALLLAGSCALLWLAGVSGSAAPARPVAIDRALYVASLAFWCFVAPLYLTRKYRVRGWLAVGIGLVVIVPSWLALTRMQHQPLDLLLLLAVVWIADSAAYFSGLAFGRHKLAPTISPGKTWEGVAGAFAAVALYACLLALADDGGRDMASIVLACLAMAALSIIGDLFESWCKRQAGVKDSGNVLPGHGGVLDRIDGVVAAVPLAALVFA
jgi:phosphatidate cytidylyltransferase